MKRICNQNDVERVSAEVLVAYFRKMGLDGTIPDCVDIDEFVTKYLKSKACLSAGVIEFCSLSDDDRT